VRKNSLKSGILGLKSKRETQDGRRETRTSIVEARENRAKKASHAVNI
jgi:hypothetical protein